MSELTKDEVIASDRSIERRKPLWGQIAVRARLKLRLQEVSINGLSRGGISIRLSPQVPHIIDVAWELRSCLD